MDVAIVKATNHVESAPKERHIRSKFHNYIFPKTLILVYDYEFLIYLSAEIFSATSAVRPRADVAYCIHALAKRLSKTRNWIVSFYYLT